MLLTDPLFVADLDEEQRQQRQQGGRFRRREAAALEAPGPRGHGCVRTSSTPPSSAPSCSNSPEPRRRRRRCPPPTPIIKAAAAPMAAQVLVLRAVPIMRRRGNRFSSRMVEARIKAAGGRLGRCTRSAWPGPTPMTTRRARIPPAGAPRPALVAMGAGTTHFHRVSATSIRRSPRTFAYCKTRSTAKRHAKLPTG